MARENHRLWRNVGTYNILSFWIPSSAALAEALEDILTMLRKVFEGNSLERVEIVCKGGVGSKGASKYVGVERKGEWRTYIPTQYTKGDRSIPRWHSLDDALTSSLNTDDLHLLGRHPHT